MAESFYDKFPKELQEKIFGLYCNSSIMFHIVAEFMRNERIIPESEFLWRVICELVKTIEEKKQKEVDKIMREPLSITIPKR